MSLSLLTYCHNLLVEEWMHPIWLQARLFKAYYWFSLDFAHVPFLLPDLLCVFSLKKSSPWVQLHAESSYVTNKYRSDLGDPRHILQFIFYHFPVEPLVVLFKFYSPFKREIDNMTTAKMVDCGAPNSPSTKAMIGSPESNKKLTTTRVMLNKE